MAKYCVFCGKQLLDEASFCINCGNKVEYDQNNVENEIENPKNKIVGFLRNTKIFSRILFGVWVVLLFLGATVGVKPFVPFFVLFTPPFLFFV